MTYTVTALDAAGNESASSPASDAVTPTVPSSSVYSFDSMATARSTWGGSTTDAALGGTTKTLESGSTDATLTVADGALKQGPATSAGRFTGLPMPTANHKITARITAPPASGDAAFLGLYGRRQAVSSAVEWRLTLKPSGAQLESVNTSATATAVGSAVAIAAGDVFELEMGAATIVVRKNGVQFASSGSSSWAGQLYCGVSTGTGGVFSTQLDEVIWHTL